MTLKEHLDAIRKGLKTGQYGNESAVSQGIVQRLLTALNWSTFDTQVVVPEYTVENRRVDFALCHPPMKPIVFIEVKQVGNIDGAERQLFEYAFHAGVPIAILTDGHEWHFFHPSGQGNYNERKVHELNLVESDNEENIERFHRYLNYNTVRAGEAVEAIKKDYEKVVQQRQVATRLPEAWNKLVEDADELLLEIIMDKVKELCGHNPTNEQVLDFLKSLKREVVSPLGKSPNPSRSTSPTPFRDNLPSNKQAAQQNLIVTMPSGKMIRHHKALDTFIEVIVELGLEKVRNVYSTIVSTEPFPNGRCHEVDQFYISTNHGTSQKKVHLEKIAELLDVQLKVETLNK